VLQWLLVPTLPRPDANKILYSAVPISETISIQFETSWWEQRRSQDISVTVRPQRRKIKAQRTNDRSLRAEGWFLVGAINLPPHHLRGLGNVVSSLSGVRGKTPAAWIFFYSYSMQTVSQDTFTCFLLVCTHTHTHSHTLFKKHTTNIHD